MKCNVLAGGFNMPRIYNEVNIRSIKILQLSGSCLTYGTSNTGHLVIQMLYQYAQHLQAADLKVLHDGRNN